MKKILSAVLCLLLVIALVACSKPQEPIIQPIETPTPTATATPESTPEPTPEVTPEVTLEPTPAQNAGPIDLSKYTVAYVAGETVNVRSQATTESERITSLPRNTEIKVYKVSGEWAYIGYGDNKKGYMFNDYVSENPVATPAPTPEPTRDPNFKYNYNSNVDINDNVFLDALEYTGYNLKKHRADGNMWVFIYGKDKAGLGYLSGLGYDYGASTGYETNSAGLPDIARFKKKGGLVCASYLTYVYFNYLPNVAGIDTSHLARPEYPCSAQSWREAANKWVKQGLSRKISFTAKRYSSGIVSFKPDETIPVGSVVVFKVAGSADSSNARHVTLYAGYAGGYHWLTHVGNDRGPEMITVENMGFGSTPEVPVEVITPPIYFE